MERIKELNGYQKALLILLAVMLVVFAILYPSVTAQEGYLYYDKLFLPEYDGSITTYSATLEGEKSAFIVNGSEVTFRWGEQTFGPYMVTESPDVVPADHSFTKGFTVTQGNTVIFQGGVYFADDWTMLYNQDGSLYGMDAIVMYAGSEVDMTPSVSSLIELVTGPELTRRGTWVGFLEGVFVTILTAIDILFADELFRFRISFRVADPDLAEPSDWEIMGRYIGWTSMTILALVGYILGLLP